MTRQTLKCARCNIDFNIYKESSISSNPEIKQDLCHACNHKLRTDPINKCVKVLDKIAELNNVRLKYRILVMSNENGVDYVFMAEDHLNRYMLVQGYGLTIDDAVQEVMNQIDAICDSRNLIKPQPA